MPTNDTGMFYFNREPMSYCCSVDVNDHAFDNAKYFVTNSIDNSVDTRFENIESKLLKLQEYINILEGDKQQQNNKLKPAYFDSWKAFEEVYKW